MVSKNSLSKRIIALLLTAVLMLVSFPLSGVMFAFAANDGFAFEVKCGEAAIENAKVTVSATSGENIITENAEYTSGKDGLVRVPEIDEYLANNADAKIDIVFSVSADGYYDVESSHIATVTAEKVKDNILVSMVANPTVSYTVTEGFESNVKVYYLDAANSEVDITSGASLPIGTKVYVRAGNVENYTLKVSEGATVITGGVYEYTLEKDGLNISVEYQPLVYTIKVEIGENGNVAPSPTISIDKTQTETVVTITPDKGYRIANVTLNGNDVTDSVLDNKLTISNNAIDGDGKLSVTFEKDVYEVTLDYVKSNQSDRGEIKLFDGDNEITIDPKTKKVEVAANKTVTVKFIPKSKYSFINATFNGTEIAYKNLGKIEGEETLSYSYSFNVEQNVKIIADFSEVIVLPPDEIENVKGYFNVNNSVLMDEIYYTSSSSVSIKLNGTITLKNGTSITPNDDNITCYRDLNNKNNTFKDVKNQKKGIEITENDNITKVQFKGEDEKVYQINADLNIRFDKQNPEIKDISAPSGWTNESQTITFSVADPTEKYNNEEYASGIKSVTVSRSYVKDEIETKENIEVNESSDKYSFTATPIDNYTGEVTYTITATDNVGNSSDETITIKNDTQAPELDKNGETPSIKFSSKKTNFFKRVINAVLYGNWNETEKKAEIIVKDNTLLEEQNITVTLGFFKDNLAETADKEIVAVGATKNGKATVSVNLDDLQKFAYKGVIKYKLSDSLGNETKYALVTKYNSNIGTEFSSIMIENNAPEFKNYSTEEEPVYISASPLNAETGKSNGDIYNGDIKFTVDVEDNESGLYSVEVVINNQTVITESDISKDGIIKSKEFSFATNSIDVDGKKINASFVDEETKETKHGYKVDITVCDNAGNVTTKTRTVYKDTTAPEIIGFDFGVDPVKNIEKTDYGFFFKKTATVKVKAQDVAGEKEVASGVKAIVAYAVDNVENNGIVSEKVYCVTQTKTGKGVLEEKTDDTVHSVEVTNNEISFDIPANFKGQIYAYAIDNVENDPKNSTFDFENECVVNDNASQFYGCVHPNGAVIEDTDKHKETSSIEITMPEASYSQAYSNSFTDADENRQLDGTPDYDTAKKVPLYNGSFNGVNVTVKDTYSGIKSVECVLKEKGVEDKIVASYPNNSDNVNNWTVNNTDINLVTEVSNKKITIDGNHNDMVLEVILTDNAGNVSYDYVMFGIDKTAPVINVAYDNNNGDVKSNNGSTYFNADRTATVTISERNFDPEKVEFTIINAEGNAPEAVRVDEINDSIESTDETQHTYQITYSGEGVYTFDVKCTDRADKTSAEVKYGESVAPTVFVLDKTAPTISVSYDNNSAANGKFFNAHRTATIVVNEHNFDVNRVVINGTASLNGAAKAFPAAAWTSNGDVHTATISYNEDADYTFAISMDDMAGNAITDASVNYGTSVAAKEFTVDTEIAKPVISNPTNGKPYQQEVPVSISSTDVNLENCVATLLKTGREKDENDNWKWVKDFRVDNVINLSNDGQTSSFSINDLFEHERLNDGIYTLKIDVADKAGNTQSETVTFTVNRFGSVYDYNQYTTETLNGKYVQAITDNIVITEYNPSPLSENAVISLTRDGAPVEIGDSNLVITPVYTESAAGASGWYEYKYEISKNVFSTVDAQGNMKYLDGIYKLYVASKDIANNDSENISAGADMSFSLDSTAPMIASITGLEKKTVNDVTKDVTFEIFDAIGLDTVEVTYVGVNGKTTETYNISDLLKSYDPATQTEKPDITKYDGSFTMGEGMNNIVRIVAKDLAGNVMDTGDPNVENSAINFDASVLAFNSLITVSTNPFVRWYSHTVFFWVSIAVIAVALGAGGYLAAVKLRKKEEKETEDYKNSKKNNK